MPFSDIYFSNIVNFQILK